VFSVVVRRPTNFNIQILISVVFILNLLEIGLSCLPYCLVNVEFLPVKPIRHLSVPLFASLDDSHLSLPPIKVDRTPRRLVSDSKNSIIWVLTMVFNSADLTELVQYLRLLFRHLPPSDRRHPLSIYDWFILRILRIPIEGHIRRVLATIPWLFSLPGIIKRWSSMHEI
jgi:hypothetical protein